MKNYRISFTLLTITILVSLFNHSCKRDEEVEREVAVRGLGEGEHGAEVVQVASLQRADVWQQPLLHAGDEHDRVLQPLRRVQGD